MSKEYDIKRKIESLYKHDEVAKLLKQYHKENITLTHLLDKIISFLTQEEVQFIYDNRHCFSFYSHEACRRRLGYFRIAND